MEITILDLFTWGFSILIFLVDALFKVPPIFNESIVRSAKTLIFLVASPPDSPRTGTFLGEQPVFMHDLSWLVVDIPLSCDDDIPN